LFSGDEPNTRPRFRENNEKETYKTGEETGQKRTQKGTSQTGMETFWQIIFNSTDSTRFVENL
jgi:hypothetical protein